MIRTVFGAVLACCVGAPLAASDMPTPRVLRDGGFQKGQWRMEILEMSRGHAGSAGMPAAMSMCMENAEKIARGGDDTAGCTYRLLKDTASEAVMESVCRDGTSRSTVTREGPRRFLMEATQTGRGESMSMKARYSYEGPCRESAGPGGVSIDRSSPQCQQALAKAAQINPAAMCADAGAQRAMCEEQARGMRAKLEAMCR